jgi:hypothetical protein
MLDEFYYFAFHSKEVESDLPDDLREECLLCFNAAVANRMNVGDAIKKVQNDVLKKCDDRFKGKYTKKHVSRDLF